MEISLKLVIVLLGLLLDLQVKVNCQSVGGTTKVIWAVNAGGPEHIDIHGVHYMEDPLHVGFASNYGAHRFLTIGRVHREDAILYQTERYDVETFGYDIPIKEDGQYVLVLKFCEVYFSNPRRKVFNVKLNHAHLIVEELDIFLEVGQGNAHDENIPFVVSKNGKELLVGGQRSPILRNTIRVEFVKGDLDNPKINAIYVWKGDLQEIPKLPRLPEGNEFAGSDQELEMEDDYYRESSEHLEMTEFDEENEDMPVRRASRPQHYYKDPYEDDDLSIYMLPVIIAVCVCLVGCFAFRGLTKSA